jgi:hypothetical protein
MTVFNASAVLLALNDRDPAVRLARVEALAGLVEDFSVALDFDEDNFLGLVDRLPPPFAEAAVG